jgi:hypothetical protein
MNPFLDGAGALKAHWRTPALSGLDYANKMIFNIKEENFV